jgi:hypothetical protein
LANSEVTTCAVFGLDDPGIRIEADFLGEALLDGVLRQGLLRDRHEEAIDRAAVVIDGLWRRRVQHRIAVEQRHLHEYRPRLLGTATAHRPEHALGLAPAQVGGNPDV